MLTVRKRIVKDVRGALLIDAMRRQCDAYNVAAASIRMRDLESFATTGIARRAELRGVAIALTWAGGTPRDPREGGAALSRRRAGIARSARCSALWVPR